MKRKITQAEFDALPDAIKALYKAHASGGFLVDLEGDDDDVAALRATNEREVAKRTAAEARVGTLETELSTLRTSVAKGDGNLTALETSWREKLTRAEADGKTALEAARKQITRILVDERALALAADISTVPALMARNLKDRLSVDFEGDVPTLRVLDTSGKPTALSVDDLVKEFTGSKEYAPIIIASKASGGGAAGAGGAGGGAAGSKKFADLSEVERTNLYRTDRAAFDRGLAESRAAANSKT